MPSPAVAVYGAVIIETDKTKVVYTQKCDACGYVMPQRTSIIGFNRTLNLYFHCPSCKNGQAVLIEGPK